MTLKANDVSAWSKAQVIQWLKDRGFNSTIRDQFYHNDIDGYVLLRLSEDDLRREPMYITNLGARKKIIGAIDEFKWVEKCSHCNHPPISTACKSFPSDSPDQAAGDCDTDNGIDAKSLKPEKFKALVALIYVVVVLYFCAIVMTIVNDRVPDMEKYPPLPDLFLDNVPYISWGFNVAEYICMSLSTVFAIIVATHRHRFIIIRRYFSLAGTLFLLRAVCMLITSLSVPCKFFQCQATEKGDGIHERLLEALHIFAAGGMSINGIRYCGDYMFSGHTTLITLINLFIDQYAPKDFPILRTLCWTANMFGIFFVLAGHEHYSIDVFIAFYLTTRLFLYYHTLADNYVGSRSDRKNVRIWFPLFYYFESECTGAIPYEFHMPLSLEYFRTKKPELSKST